MKTVLLSVVVSVFNGEKEFDDCLKSVAFADEIIVVDNSSTDRTEEIARKYTDKIFTRPNNPMLNVNKNFGFSKASGVWILSLDADEQVTPELAKEIKNILDQRPETKDEELINGYWIPRKNIIFGKWIEHTGWYPDRQLRFFRKGKGQFPEKHVHEMVKIDGKIGHLENDLIHMSYESMYQFMQKAIGIYIPNEADQLIKNGYRFDWRDAIRMPTKEFISRFFAREGYKDGLHGLILSMLMAFYHLLIFATIWEKKGFEKIENKDFVRETEEEFKKSYKDLFFWIDSEKIKSTKNPFKKAVYKAIRKFCAK